MAHKIGLICSDDFSAILSSGADMVVVMTTNDDADVAKGFLASVTAGQISICPFVSFASALAALSCQNNVLRHVAVIVVVIVVIGYTCRST